MVVCESIRIAFNVQIVILKLLLLFEIIFLQQTKLLAVKKFIKKNKIQEATKSNACLTRFFICDSTKL